MSKSQYEYREGLTESAAAPHSTARRGIVLWAVFLPSLTPVLSFTVTGISPKARFMPTTIFPSLAAASSTAQFSFSQTQSEDYRGNLHAEPLPCLYTRSIGHPQLMSTKSRLPAHTLPRISAAGTSSWGLLPAICIPKMDSEGCRLTRDHSSLEP